jgi:LuxR family maltose regulon positive regulatory protein
LVPRPHLYRRLDEGARVGLTLVSAPAGFGKSTLVGSWIAAGARQAAWLSLDEADNDPARGRQPARYRIRLAVCFRQA